jgi:hypothetical protein
MKHELEANLKKAMRGWGTLRPDLITGKTLTIHLTLPDLPPMFKDWQHGSPSYLQGQGDWVGRIDTLNISFVPPTPATEAWDGNFEAHGVWRVGVKLTLAIPDEEPDGFWDRWDADVRAVQFESEGKRREP